MANTKQSGSHNNNPTGKNQYSGFANTVRNNPIASAAAAGAAAAAGIFLWTKRERIGEQAGKMNEKVSNWRDNRGSDSDSGGRTASPMGAEGSSMSGIGSAATTSASSGNAKATGTHAGKARASQPVTTSELH